MVNNYKKFLKQNHYSLQDILAQIALLKKHYDDVQYQIRKDHFTIDIFISLKPTSNSQTYKLKLVSKIGSTAVSIYPFEPYIGTKENGKTVPHMYSDGSLCLYYPKYHEWVYTDYWANTLIPWSSLWLYYYEIWNLTGEWLGGGIHGNKRKS